PALTTVNQDVEGQARLAASILIGMAQGRPPRADRAVANRLVVRGSTGVDLNQPADARAALTDANRLLWAKLSTQEALLALSQAMFRCRSVDDITTALISCLERLGIVRCRLAVHERSTPG